MFGGDQGGDGRGGPSGEKFPRGDHVEGWEGSFWQIDLGGFACED